MRKKDHKSNGNEYILSYFADTNAYHFHGKHKGQITGNALSIETFKKKKDMEARIVELGIEIPEELQGNKDRHEVFEIISARADKESEERRKKWEKDHGKKLIDSP